MYTAPDGSFSALMPPPTVTVIPQGTLYTSHAGKAEYQVLVTVSPDPNQALVNFANSMVRFKTAQGFAHSQIMSKNHNGFPYLECSFWTMFKKSDMIFCPGNGHIVTFCAVLGKRDNNALVLPFFNSIVAR